jgi:hypothetical protein
MPTIADAIDRIEQTLAGAGFNEGDHPRTSSGNGFSSRKPKERK